MPRISTKDIKSFKNSKKIVMITAYDALFANLFDKYVDILLVGDSLNMSFGGQEDTIYKLGIKEMIYHTNAVARGSSKSMIIMDMPFGTYADKKLAFKNASKAMKKSPICGVKLEGGKDIAEIIKHLTSNSIPVMAHIGLLPQDVNIDGGYKIKDEKDKLIADAIALQKAGAFAIVCEGIKSNIAKDITKSVDIPVIGIGAGIDVDGQVLVWSDMLGFFDKFTPKFVRQYLDGATLVQDAIKQYSQDVKTNKFPSLKESYE
jgi:3-methyl-2-oxobutanoate hydroxymethyltransferase